MISADSTTEDRQSETSLDVRVQGQTKDLNTIFLKLRIADSTGLSPLFFIVLSFHHWKIFNPFAFIIVFSY